MFCQSGRDLSLLLPRAPQSHLPPRSAHQRDEREGSGFCLPETGSLLSRAPPPLRPRLSQWLTRPSSEGAWPSLDRALQCSSQSPAGLGAGGTVPRHPHACHGTDCQRQRVAGCLLRPSGAGFHHRTDCKASGQGLSPQRGQLRALQKQAVGSTVVTKCWFCLKSQVSDPKSPPAFCSPG